MKFQYRVEDKFTLDPLANVDYYSLGSIDDFEFRRRKIPVINNSKIMAEHLLKNRINNLRKKYQYIRLWYSGGKDSTLALHTAIKNNVLIDEIVLMRRVCKNGLNLYPEYAQTVEMDQAILYLNSIKHQIPKTKISVVETDDEHHESIFTNADWYRFTSDWHFQISYTMNMFYRYVNPKFQLLEEVADRCDLCGSGVPNIWFNNSINKWQFSFVDAVFVTSHSGAALNTVFEDFLVSDDDPLLLEFFINTIADSFEQEFKGRDIIKPAVSPVEQYRKIRDRSSLYSTLENYNIFQFEKAVAPYTPPTDHIFWKIHYSVKGFNDMINRYYQSPMPKCFDLYMNQTPWDLIEQHAKKRVSTKTWTLV